MGTNKIVVLRTEFAPGVWRETSFSVPEYDPKATPGAWDKLPESQAKQVKDAIELMKKQKANQPGRVIPPR
jgi:hypothetical protein